ncbi:MAG: hypothetical protein MK291_01090 [Planctomycetes bacterium]|nr:hypothetical protein [Planctomycetota bacterium]
MAGSFQTDEGHSNERLQPLRVPMRKEHLFGAARELVDDLSSWKLDSADEESTTMHCTLEGGFLRGPSKITIEVEGPEDLPTSTVRVRSETETGLMKRDKANVQEFMLLLHRRVC